MTIHEDLAAHLSDFGLNVMGCVPLSNRRSASNPSELSIRWNARRHTTYRLFAWNITHEGRGRKNDNLRVQATSFGNTNSPIEVDPTVLCVGWSEPHAVYVGFDPWIKRFPGGSSSVHIRRDLVDRASKSGLEYGGDAWDPRIAFTGPNAASLLDWASGLWNSKTVSLKCLDTETISADRVRLRVDPKGSPRSHGVRVDDRVAAFDARGVNPDPYLWRVQAIERIPVAAPGGGNRFHFLFVCERSARVRNALEAP